MAHAHDQEPAQPSQPPAPGEPALSPSEVAWMRMLMRYLDGATRKVVVHAPGKRRGPRQ